MSYPHIPVMVSEVLLYLACKPGDVVVDGTLGGAGHARAILGKILPGGMLIGIDRDRDAIENARTVLAPFVQNIRLFHGNFSRLPEFLSQLNIGAVDGILVDLGVSLHHLTASGRGFSFNREEPLDMRMNIDSDTTAEALINRLEENALRKIFFDYGEERWARQIARHIVAVRKREKIVSSRQLAGIVAGAIPKKSLYPQRIHPATRVFMALRIAVNRELEHLDAFLETVPGTLNAGGRLCVLSFHSLEDRRVKQRFRALETDCICPPDFPRCVCNRRKQIRVLTRKPQRPSAAEVSANPMARSTLLRACEKL